MLYFDSWTTQLLPEHILTVFIRYMLVKLYLTSSLAHYWRPSVWPIYSNDMVKLRVVAILIRNHFYVRPVAEGGEGFPPDSLWCKLLHFHPVSTLMSFHNSEHTLGVFGSKRIPHWEWLATGVTITQLPGDWNHHNNFKINWRIYL
jgi:hypothetical protein